MSLLSPDVQSTHNTHQRSFVDCPAESENNLNYRFNTKDCTIASDPETELVIKNDFLVVEDFISETEEASLLGEIEPYLKRLRYEKDHWDDVCYEKVQYYLTQGSYAP
jgi:alkylated DNA repair protein alkB family protein 7